MGHCACTVCVCVFLCFCAEQGGEGVGMRDWLDGFTYLSYPLFYHTLSGIETLSESLKGLLNPKQPTNKLISKVYDMQITFLL